MKNLADWFGYFLLKFLTRVMNSLSAEAALKAGQGLGFLAFHLSPRRGVAYADLKAALDRDLSEKARWRIIRNQFENLGRMSVEILRFRSLGKKEMEKYIQVHGFERYDQAVRSGRGVIFLTAHLGNWELSQIWSGIMGNPVYVLGQVQRHSRMDHYLKELRETRAAKVVTVGMGTRGILRALYQKKIVGILGDQTAGKHEGVILPFLGRKTSVPTGAFKLAQRTGAVLMPCFIVRRHGAHHDFYFEESLEIDSSQKDLSEPVSKYLRKLENYIRCHPDQWLWEGKRWKYTWTKRLLILSDGKPGHEKQSRSVAERFRDLQTQYGRPGMEYPTEIIRVQFKSPWHRRLFYIFAVFYIPFAAGRMRYLRFFLEKECYKKMMRASADFVISAGSSLVPLNLCVVRDSRAKSIVLMKPNFPYLFFHFDLALVPAHDRGLMPKNILRTFLTPSETGASSLASDAAKLRSSLKDPARVKIGVFLGGATGDFKMELSSIESVFSSLTRVSKKYGDYMITTSRRTPDAVSTYLKQKVVQDPSCQLFVDVREDRRSEVVGGMMALADFLIVTEDSISMISEAVSARKKVIVLTFESNGLSPKHHRFREMLAGKSAVAVARPEILEQTLERLEKIPSSHFVQEQSEVLCEKLREIL